MGYMFISNKDLPKTKDDVKQIRAEFTVNALHALVDGAMTSDMVFAGMEVLDKIENLLPERVDEPDA